jgi:hypothetical protein
VHQRCIANPDQKFSIRLQHRQSEPPSASSIPDAPSASTIRLQQSVIAATVRVQHPVAAFSNSIRWFRLLYSQVSLFRKFRFA